VYTSSTEIWIDIPQTCGASGCASSTTLTFRVSNLVNPSSLLANSATTRFKIYTVAASYPSTAYIDGATDEVPLTELVGQTVQVQSVTLGNYRTNNYTDFKIQLQSGYALTSSAMFDIYFPTGFAYPNGTTTCYIVTIDDTGIDCDFELDSDGYIYKVTLNGPCPSGCVADYSYIYKIPILTREDTYPVGGSFHVISKYSTIDVGEGTLSNIITLYPNLLTNYSVEAIDDCTKIDAFCSILLYFKIQNPLPSIANRGRVYIQIPSSLEILVYNCDAKVAIDTWETYCSMNDHIITITHQRADYLYEAEFYVEIRRIKNPSSLNPTSSFLIYTQVDTNNDGNYYSIDAVTSGLTYASLTPGDLVYAKVTRFPLEDNSGYETGQPTQLMFDFKIDHALERTSVFMIQFPEAAEVELDEESTSHSCYRVSSEGYRRNMLFC